MKQEIDIWFLRQLYADFGEKAQDVLDFIKANTSQDEEVKTEIKETKKYKDGVYLMYDDGRLEVFNGENNKSCGLCVAIVDNGAVFCLYDKDVEGCLVPDCGKCEDEHARYFEREVDALGDRDCVSGTKQLIDCGCTMDIPEGFYIPALAQLVLIIRHIDEVNKALKYIGHEPIKKNEWYWSCTEYSATNAWGVGTSSGRVYPPTKSTYSYYVRPVSAFMLSI